MIHYTRKTGNPKSGLKQRHDKTLLLRNSRTQIELFRVSQSLERFPTDQVSKRIQDPKRASKSVQKPYTICLLSFATYVATNSQPVLSYRSRSGYRKPPILHYINISHILCKLRHKTHGYRFISNMFIPNIHTWKRRKIKKLFQSLARSFHSFTRTQTQLHIFSNFRTSSRSENACR